MKLNKGALIENFELTLDWASRDPLSILFGILAGVLIFWIGRWFAKLATRYASRSMERARVDHMAVRFLQTVIYFGVMGVVIIAALNAAGLHTTSLTALLASAGVAIGLAAALAFSLGSREIAERVVDRFITQVRNEDNNE